jgi:hypothetical protein
MLATLAVGVAALGVAAYALAGGSGPGFNHLSATLGGYQEVPSVSSTGPASFTADVAKDGQSVVWQMSYANLEGNVTQSHIHFGQRSVNGGISVFLCTNLGNGPAGTQACPGPHDGTFSGTFGPTDVIGPGVQGITAGEWDELMNAIDAGKAYANIHSTTWPGGEIRAQLNEGDPHN